MYRAIKFTIFVRMDKILFRNADVVSQIKESGSIKKLIISTCKAEGFLIESITYVFCSDNYLLTMNRQFLKHDTFTDIITFPLSAKRDPIIAEIYISVERVKENAKTYSVSYQNELLRVIIHGALHLCGYADKTPTQKLAMRRRETYYLNKFNVSREADS